jgi:hypothetical protein
MSDDGRRLVVELRNNGWRTVTAWAVTVTHGNTEGIGRDTTHAVDNVMGLVPGAPSEVAPIRPSETRRFEIPLQRRVNLSPDRFSSGNYDVLTVDVAATVFDDGSYSGRDLRPVEKLLRDRFSRALATQDLLNRIDTALAEDTVEAFVRNTLVKSADSQAQAKPVPATFSESLVNMEHFVNQQWASSILWLAAPEVANRLSRDGSLSLSPGLDPAQFRRAAEQVRSAVAAEAKVYREHLPPVLNGYVDDMRAARE